MRRAAGKTGERQAARLLAMWRAYRAVLATKNLDAAELAPLAAGELHVRGVAAMFT
jgi:hypothetical protein